MKIKNPFHCWAHILARLLPGAPARTRTSHPSAPRADLDVSEITVKVRRGHLMRKMNTRTLADLIRLLDRIQPT